MEKDPHSLTFRNPFTFAISICILFLFGFGVGRFSEDPEKVYIKPQIDYQQLLEQVNWLVDSRVYHDSLEKVWMTDADKRNLFMGWYNEHKDGKPPLDLVPVSEAQWKFHTGEIVK